VWIDLEQPTNEEIQQIAQEFSMSELIERELFSPTPSPLIVDGGTSALLVLHFPTQGAETGETKNQEVDFIVGSNFIITVHYEIVEPLHHLKKLFETRDLIMNHESITTDALLEILFVHMYAAVHNHTRHLSDRLEHIEQDMFNGHERTTVRAISNVSRAFLHLEALLANQEEPLGRFLGAQTVRDLFDSSFPERAEHILTERTQAMHLTKTYRSVATEMRETNSALLESRQNEIMKVLTVITFIFLPLELLTFIFGMHSLGDPLEQNPNAFWIITSSMAALGAVITLFLARKRWIF
jgi:magnesium transporter